MIPTTPDRPLSERLSEIADLIDANYRGGQPGKHTLVPTHAEEIREAAALLGQSESEVKRFVASILCNGGEWPEGYTAFALCLGEKDPDIRFLQEEYAGELPWVGRYGLHTEVGPFQTAAETAERLAAAIEEAPIGRIGPAGQSP